MLISQNDKLKKISDSVFQEAAPPEDRSRPLEWRRGFNFVSLPLKNIEIINSCTVHDIDFRLRDEEPSDPFLLVTPNVTDRILIGGDLDRDQMRDSIYFAIDDKDGAGTYSLERAGSTRVIVKASDPVEAVEGKNPAGLYRGLAFRDDEPGGYDLIFDLSIPRDQMTSLLAASKEAENIAVKVGVDLLSFTYEIDDLLREHYHPQNIVINNFTPCFVSWVEIKSRVGHRYVQVDREAESGGGTSPNQDMMTPEQRAHHELMTVLMSYSKPLKRLATAAWILVVVVAVYAFVS